MSPESGNRFRDEDMLEHQVVNGGLLAGIAAGRKRLSGHNDEIVRGKF